jgi:hypothetical protein
VRNARSAAGCREACAFLAKKGVDISGDQQTKTKTALEFFANELSAS